MPSRTFRIATVGGVDVRLAPSWIVIAVAIVWTYRATFTADGRSLTLSLAMAVAAAVLFTASVLVHELAHALEGQHRGAEVEGITLFLLGGATAMRGGEERAVDELAIAAIGPWSNIVLAALFGLLATSADAGDAAEIAAVAALLGWLNLGLAAFNLVPGAPLDGGRMLRATIWAITGDRARSAVAAAWAGLVLAALLLGLATWLIAATPGGIASGLWLGLIGAYVLRAARLELVRARLTQWLAGHTAGSLAPPLPEQPVSASVADLVRMFAADGAPAAIQIIDMPGSPVGVIDRDLPSELLMSAPAARVAGGVAADLADFPVVSADGPADALANLLDADQPYVVVTDGTYRWVSSLALIDAAIVDRRREQTS